MEPRAGNGTTSREWNHEQGMEPDGFRDAASRISEITELIKKIADKTNLLALNAHIEGG